MSKAVESVRCNTAEELMIGLGRENRAWSDSRHFWVFRGHEDDSYQLVPSALRSNAELGYTSDPRRGVQATNGQQFTAEFDRIHEYYWSVDAQGLQVAGNTDLLRTPAGWQQLWEKVRGEGWPVGDLLPLLALAQHYGVSTRLLDWTEKPLVAAYFACKGAVQKNTSVLGVWALNLDWVINIGFPGAAKKIGVYVVTAPRASNPNLHAQGGVFTTEQIKHPDLGRQVVVSTVDQLVERRWKRRRTSVPVMVHFSLPSREAPKLLRLLHQDGVSAATLFPGYQGVAEALAERKHWDRAERGSYWVRP